MRTITACHIGLTVLLVGSLTSSLTPPVAAAEAETRLAAVRAFADNVLEKGRDRWSGRDTPLLADGINVRTGEPVEWVYNGERFIVHNLASQQNLFRTFTALTNLTGEAQYRRAAEEAFTYHFEHLRSDCGLLRWGGHQIINLATLEPVGHFDADCHEFKMNYPFYELMWEVDPQATRAFLHAFWNAHILDWGRLDMNRHGQYGLEMGELWDHDFEQPEPFFEGQGLTFINAGSDLIYAGGMLYKLDQDSGALEWANRLADQYVRARHPDTGLGVYQYSQLSDGRDRALNQFGEQFPEVALEGWALWGGRTRVIYVSNALMQLELAEMLGEQGRGLLEGTVDGLKAFAEHAYEPEENHFRPMWADGTDLTGYELPRGGYYGSQGNRLGPVSGGARFLFSYARAYRLSGDGELWQVIRSIAEGMGLGDVGPDPSHAPELNTETGTSNAYTLFALLELARITDDLAYLALAEVVGDNILDDRFHHGFFMSSERHLNANFNAIEPLALLSLEAALRGEPEAVPTFSGGRGYIHGRFDGMGRTYDGRALWSQRYVPLRGIELETDSLDIRGSKSLVATLAPRDATLTEVTWQSSDSDVVRIASTTKPDALHAEAGRSIARLEAVNPGSATVTATTAEGEHTATARVTVKAYDDDMLERLELDGEAIAGFDPTVADYTALTTRSVEDLTLSATPARRDAAVTIDPPRSLPGSFAIEVTPADGGESRSYTIDVRPLLTVDGEPLGGSAQGEPQRRDGYYRFQSRAAVVFGDAGIEVEDDKPFSIAVRARMHDDRRFFGMYRWHLQRGQFRTRGDDPIRLRTGINDNEPHAIVVTYQPQADGDAAEMRLYVDGELVDASTTTGSPLSSYSRRHPRVGKTAHSGGRYSNVDVAEVRLYSRVLDEDEIENFSAGTFFSPHD